MTGPESKRLAPVLDIPALVAKVARLLQEAGVPEFALIGGCAMRVYGLERMTKDVDFVVKEKAHVALLAHFSGTVKPLAIGGYSLTLPEGVVDLIDRRRELRALYEEALDVSYQVGLKVMAQDIEVHVVSLEHLIAMKLAAGRAQDEADVIYLLKLTTLDYPKARECAKKHLGFLAGTTLDRLARIAGRGELVKEYEEESSGA
jgi:predicted nucleotidyltransferase